MCLLTSRPLSKLKAREAAMSNYTHVFYFTGTSFFNISVLWGKKTVLMDTYRDLVGTSSGTTKGTQLHGGEEFVD